jgi:hypothetical protein
VNLSEVGDEVRVVVVVKVVVGDVEVVTVVVVTEVFPVVEIQKC